MLRDGKGTRRWSRCPTCVAHQDESRRVLAEPLSRFIGLVHPTELVFLTRHVVGQIHWGPGVTACQWTPLTAATQSMLPPWPAEQVLHALAGNTEPVIAHQATHAAGRLHVSR